MLEFFHLGKKEHLCYFLYIQNLFEGRRSVDKEKGDHSPHSEDEKTSSPDLGSSTPEEPIILNKLFPNAKQNVDALFPDADMKKLLRAVVRSRQKNERLLKTIHIDEHSPEEDHDPEEPF